VSASAGKATVFVRAEEFACEPEKSHRRSLHCAPPDFLWNLVALVHFMRLSLTERRTRGLVQRSVAGNPGTLRSR
jgi:hypothetical protein